MNNCKPTFVPPCMYLLPKNLIKMLKTKSCLTTLGLLCTSAYVYLSGIVERMIAEIISRTEVPRKPISI